MSNRTMRYFEHGTLIKSNCVVAPHLLTMNKPHMIPLQDVGFIQKLDERPTRKVASLSVVIKTFDNDWSIQLSLDDKLEVLASDTDSASWRSRVILQPSSEVAFAEASHRCFAKTDMNKSKTDATRMFMNINREKNINVPKKK